MDRVLVFGGTFDPPHRAHVELSALAAERLGCDRIVYVPAARNPLKKNASPTGDEHRRAMLAIAVRDVPGAHVSTLELDRGGPSYFVETLDSLARDLGSDTELIFLIGADQALDFHRWHEWKRILELAAPAVLLRPPWDAATFRAALDERYDEAESQQWAAAILDAPAIELSATDLRARLGRGEGAGDLVDGEVAAYIAQHGLYRA